MKIFDSVILTYPPLRSDSRGDMCAIFGKSTTRPGISFDMQSLRSYTMPQKGTFVGIHYDEDTSKLITVLRGCGADYVIDLRRNSPTYLKWEMNILSARNRAVIYIPKGFGHAFLSLEDDTLQLFACDTEHPSKRINYKDKRIALELPIPVSAISPADNDAPFTVGMTDTD